MISFVTTLSEYSEYSDRYLHNSMTVYLYARCIWFSMTRSNVDLHLYVIGSGNQNPLFFSATLNCLYETLSLLFRKSVEKRAVIDQLDAVFLVLDEICDNGVSVDKLIINVYSHGSG